MNKVKKYISIMLALAMTLTVFSSEVSATNENATGGEILRNIYENAQVNLDINSLNETDDSKSAMQYSYLQNAIKNETINPQYYGGAYLEDGKLVIMLTDINAETISSFAKVMGDNDYLNIDELSNSNRVTGKDIVYEQCEVSWKELENIKSYISNFWENYIPSSDKDMNELVDSLVAVGIYDDKNIVNVKMTDCTEEKIELFKEKIMNSKYIIFSNTEGVHLDSSTTLNAGAKIRIGSGSGFYSIGFRCKRLLSDGSYEYGFVTAAHGNSLLATAYTPSGTAFGCITKRQYFNFGNTDAAFVCLYDDCVVSNLILNTGNSLRPGAIWETFNVGDTVFKAGYNGRSQGKIVSLSEDVEGSSGVIIRDMFIADYTSAGGDSGGLIYTHYNSYNYIAGIHRASSADGSLKAFVKVRHIMDDLGITPY